MDIEQRQAWTVCMVCFRQVRTRVNRDLNYVVTISVSTLLILQVPLAAMSNGVDGSGSKIGPCCASLSIAHEEREREKANGGKMKEPAAEVGTASAQVEAAATVHEPAGSLLMPSSPVGPQTTFVGEQITSSQAHTSAASSSAQTSNLRQKNNSEDATDGSLNSKETFHGWPSPEESDHQDQLHENQQVGKFTSLCNT